MKKEKELQRLREQMEMGMEVGLLRDILSNSVS